MATSDPQSTDQNVCTVCDTPDGDHLDWCTPQARAAARTSNEQLREALVDVSLWLRAALNCKQWVWDSDQRLAAMGCLVEADQALCLPVETNGDVFARFPVGTLFQKQENGTVVALTPEGGNAAIPPGENICVCSHSLSMHLTARYDNEPTSHHCGVDGCDCQDFEEAESCSDELVKQGAAPSEITKRGARCAYCGRPDGGHTLACSALRAESSEKTSGAKE